MNPRHSPFFDACNVCWTRYDSEPFSTTLKVKRRRKAWRGSDEHGVSLGAPVEVNVASVSGASVVGVAEQWVSARVVKIHNDGTAMVAYDPRKGICSEVHVAVERLRGALEQEPPLPHGPGNTVYPEVLRALGIGHSFDTGAAVVRL